MSRELFFIPNFHSPELAQDTASQIGVRLTPEDLKINRSFIPFWTKIIEQISTLSLTNTRVYMDSYRGPVVNISKGMGHNFLYKNASGLERPAYLEEDAIQAIANRSRRTILQTTEDPAAVQAYLDEIINWSKIEATIDWGDPATGDVPDQIWKMYSPLVFEHTQKMNLLTRNRDIIVADNIGRTLGLDEIGFLLMGLDHNVGLYLPEDIKVTPLLQELSYFYNEYHSFDEARMRDFFGDIT